MSSKIKIITSANAAKAGKDLASAIESRTGIQPDVATTTGGSEKLGRILDTLAILRETEATLKAEAAKLIEKDPGLIRGTEQLSLDRRIDNTVANRALIRERLGPNRPMHPPEEFILAGAAAGMGAPANHLGSVVYLKCQHANTSEAQFREALNHPVRSTIELGEQIQRRIEKPTIRNIPEPEMGD